MKNINIISDNNKKSLNIKNKLIKILNKKKIDNLPIVLVIGGDGFMLKTLKKFTYSSCSIINIGINTHENNSCPRGEIGRHKGLKILAIYGVPVRVWPRAPLNYDKSIYSIR